MSPTDKLAIGFFAIAVVIVIVMIFSAGKGKK